MPDVNDVQLTGNITKDLRFAEPGGRKVANFTVASSESYTDRSGEKKEATQFVAVAAWGKLAEQCSGLGKGSRVRVHGSLRTTSWEDKETGEKKYRTEVVARELWAPLGSKSKPVADTSSDPYDFD